MKKKIIQAPKSKPGNCGPELNPAHADNFLSPKFLDLLPYGIIFLKKRFDEDGNQRLNYIYLNKIAEGFLGLKDAPYLNEDISRYPGRLPLHYLSAIKGVLENGKAFSEEFSILIDGNKTAFKINSLKNNDGVLVVLEDITKTKELNSQLLKTGEILAEVQNVACVGSFSWSFESKKLVCSRQVFIILGEDHTTDFTIKDFEKLIHPQDKGKVNKVLENVLQDMPPHDVEFRVILKNQSEKVVYVRVKMLFGESGNPEEIYGTLADITKNKNMDAELERKNDEVRLAYKNVETAKKDLEKLNRHLKKEIAKQTKALNVKNEQLEKINNELDDFVYTASHDLKSPISNIEGLLNALVSELDTDNMEIHHIVGLLNLSLNKFKATLQDLSEIAQVKTKEEEEQLINCNSLFEDVKFSIHDEIIKYSAHIDSDFSNAPEIYFSRNNLRSILVNLLSNGLKYSTPLRRPEIKIKTEKKNGYVVLSVTDNGLGIKPEDREKIFSVFKRVYTHVSGSGVGLYIIKRIVENNDGKIEVESELNKGSVFKIYLKNKS